MLSRYPHVLNTPNFGGVVSDLGISIPTIKHDNLSGYRRIPTSKSCRSEKFAPSVTTLRNTYTPTNPQEERGEEMYT